LKSIRLRFSVLTSGSEVVYGETHAQQGKFEIF
jgi:hypothetical protein